MFKVMEYLRAGNNDFALTVHGIYRIPILVARQRKRNNFYYLEPSLA